VCKELCDENGEAQSCQQCGCLICFDVQYGDDVERPAYVTSSGDLYCDRCGSSVEREIEAAEAEDCGEIEFDPCDE
jgi:hypothetical protein